MFIDKCPPYAGFVILAKAISEIYMALGVPQISIYSERVTNKER